MDIILKPIDAFLNKITMYKLVFYYCLVLLGAAILLGFLGFLPYTGMDILFSSVFILLICLISNKVFAWAFNAPTNVESVYITAFILALIVSPLSSIHDGNYFTLSILASILGIASKYIIAIKKKHIFNPAAFGVAIVSIFLGLSASWWVGALILLPFVIIGGLLMTRKLRRFDLVLSFIIVSLISITAAGLIRGFSVGPTLYKAVAHTPLFFFAFVMLTEPLTTPPKKYSRIWYGVLVGAIFAPSIHVGEVYSTPELSLLVGNIFSYIISPKYKLVLKLKEKRKVSKGVYDFIFDKNGPFKFEPGQYLEWTLPHKNPDSRGNRRYFTISSSPTESELMIGVKFYDNGSSFKNELQNMKEGGVIVGSQLTGDFLLPKDKDKKLAFIGGGIGITPFRSMIKYLSDREEKRNVILFYTNKTEEDIAYKEIFDDAEKKLGIKTHYLLDEKNEYLNEARLKENVPDFLERTFYISGPRGMIVVFEETLLKLGVKGSNIITDFFPGFA